MSGVVMAERPGSEPSCRTGPDGVGSEGSRAGAAEESGSDDASGATGAISGAPGA